MKIALLSLPNHPLLTHHLNIFRKNNISIDSVLFDSKVLESKDLQIFRSRTGDHLPPPLSLDYFEASPIPFYFFSSHNGAMLENFVRKNHIDILINAGTPRILKSHILNAPRLGVLNCHPGLLPNYRGCSCPEWAIYNDEKIGNTVHFMSEKIDVGPIVTSASLTFNKLDNYQSIRSQTYMGGIELLAKSIHLISKPGFNLNHLSSTTGGKYYKPIPDQLYEQVLRKIQKGNYKYQL